MVLVGTSGFSYKDWKGVFYPEAIKDPEMLVFYAGRFPCVELDFTYYQMPGAKTMEGLARKVPEGFEFCVKANKAMTHELVEKMMYLTRYRTRAEARQSLFEYMECYYNRIRLRFALGYKRPCEHERRTLAA